MDPGIIDAAAVMLEAGVITETGKMLSKKEALEEGIPEALTERIEGEGNERRFRLTDRDHGKEVVLTQKDIRELQLAKAAVLGGMMTLMDKLEFSVDMIDRIMIAGAFGSYIDHNSAIKIALLPIVPSDKIVSIGNAAGVGAAMALLSEEILHKAEEEICEIEHVNLAEEKQFQDHYVSCMLFDPELVED